MRVVSTAWPQGRRAHDNDTAAAKKLEMHTKPIINTESCCSFMCPAAYFTEVAESPERAMATDSGTGTPNETDISHTHNCYLKHFKT